MYPDDSMEQGRQFRLSQEYYFTSASQQDLVRRFLLDYEDLRTMPNFFAIQLNDTHPAIVVPELMQRLTDEHGLPTKEAFHITRACLRYTDHTSLPEALEH